MAASELGDQTPLDSKRSTNTFRGRSVLERIVDYAVACQKIQSLTWGQWKTSKTRQLSAKAFIQSISDQADLYNDNLKIASFHSISLIEIYAVTFMWFFWTDSCCFVIVDILSTRLIEKYHCQPYSGIERLIFSNWKWCNHIEWTNFTKLN